MPCREAAIRLAMPKLGVEGVEICTHQYWRDGMAPACPAGGASATDSVVGGPAVADSYLFWSTYEQPVGFLDPLASSAPSGAQHRRGREHHSGGRM
jgi:hypothetical protein